MCERDSIPERIAVASGNIDTLGRRRRALWRTSFGFSDSGVERVAVFAPDIECQWPAARGADVHRNERSAVGAKVHVKEISPSCVPGVGVYIIGIMCTGEGGCICACAFSVSGFSNICVVGCCEGSRDASEKVSRSSEGSYIATKVNSV